MLQTSHVGQIYHDLHRLYHRDPLAYPYEMCRICSVHVQPRKHELDHAGHMAPTLQHEPDHTDHTDHTDQDYIYLP